MMKLKGLLALLLVLSVAAPAFMPVDAKAQENTWKGVTLLYSSDIKGKIEPCG